MLFDAILAGSRLFHNVEPLGGFYDDYLKEKRWQLWKQQETIDLAEIDRLILFINQWRTHYENSRTSQQSLLDAIRNVFPPFQALEAENLLGVDFKRQLSSRVKPFHRQFSKFLKQSLRVGGDMNQRAQQKLSILSIPNYLSCGTWLSVGGILLMVTVTITGIVSFHVFKCL